MSCGSVTRTPTLTNLEVWLVEDLSNSAFLAKANETELVIKNLAVVFVVTSLTGGGHSVWISVFQHELHLLESPRRRLLPYFNHPFCCDSLLPC